MSAISPTWTSHWRPLITILGYVTDNAGKPLDDAYVRASGPAYASDWTDSCGLYWLKLNKPGTYSI